MIEQCIYGRADNRHQNANGQLVEAGYGRLACSQGYADVCEYSERFISSYSHRAPDAFRKLPTVMSMFEVEVPGSNGGKVHILQTNTFISTVSRDTHIAHQYVAGDEKGITSIVANPLLWVQARFQTAKKEPIDYRVLQDNGLKAYSAFDVGALSDVLSYFQMDCESFAKLLNSVFIACKTPNSAVIVLVDDKRPDYAEWVKRLVVHLYTFLPFSMRRRAGFETWFSGSMLVGNAIKLCFAGISCFRTMNGTGYLSLGMNDAGGYFDTSKCILFMKKDSKACNEEQKAEIRNLETPYQRYIRKFLEAAYTRRENCPQVEKVLNNYWGILDEKNPGLETVNSGAYQTLQKVELLKNNKYIVSKDTIEADAAELFANIGENGMKLLAERIACDETVTSDKEWADIYLRMLNGSKYGSNMAVCVTGQLKGTLRSIRMIPAAIETVFNATKPGSGNELDSETRLAVLQNADVSNNGWEDCKHLRSVEKLIYEGETELRTVLRRLIIGAVPGSFPVDSDSKAFLSEIISIHDIEYRNRMLKAFLGGITTDVLQISEAVTGIIDSCGDDTDVCEYCFDAVIRTLQGNYVTIKEAGELISTGYLQFDAVKAEKLVRVVLERLSGEYECFEDVCKLFSSLKEVLKDSAVNPDLRNEAGKLLFTINGLQPAEYIQLGMSYAGVVCDAESIVRLIEAQPVTDISALGGLYDIQTDADDDNISNAFNAYSVRCFEAAAINADSVERAINILDKFDEPLCSDCICAAFKGYIPYNPKATYTMCLELLARLEMTAEAAGMLESIVLKAIKADEAVYQSAQILTKITDLSRISNEAADEIATALTAGSGNCRPNEFVKLIIGCICASTRDRVRQKLFDGICTYTDNLDLSPSEAEDIADEALKMPAQFATEFTGKMIRRIHTSEQSDKVRVINLYLKAMTCIENGVNPDCVVGMLEDYNPDSAMVRRLCDVLKQPAAKNAMSYETDLYQCVSRASISIDDRLNAYDKYRDYIQYVSEKEYAELLARNLNSLAEVRKLQNWTEQNQRSSDEVSAKLVETCEQIIAHMGTDEVLDALTEYASPMTTGLLCKRLEETSAAISSDSDADAIATQLKRVIALGEIIAKSGEIVCALLDGIAKGKANNPVRLISEMLEIMPSAAQSHRRASSLGAALINAVNSASEQDAAALGEKLGAWVTQMQKCGLSEHGEFAKALIDNMIRVGTCSVSADGIEYITWLVNEEEQSEIRKGALELFCAYVIARAKRSAEARNLSSTKWEQLVKTLTYADDVANVLAHCVTSVERKYPGITELFIKGWWEKERAEEEVYRLYCAFAAVLSDEEDTFRKKEYDILALELHRRIASIVFNFDDMYRYLVDKPAKYGVNYDDLSTWVEFISSKRKYNRNISFSKVIDEELIEAVEYAGKSKAFYNYVLWRIELLVDCCLAPDMDNDCRKKLTELFDISGRRELLSAISRLCRNRTFEPDRDKVSDYLRRMCKMYCKLFDGIQNPKYPLLFPESEYALVDEACDSGECPELIAVYIATSVFEGQRDTACVDGKAPELRNRVIEIYKRIAPTYAKARDK